MDNPSQWAILCFLCATAVAAALGCYCLALGYVSIAFSISRPQLAIPEVS